MNERAFSDLLAAHRDRVHRYVATMIADPEAADDVTQDVVHRATAARDTLSDVRRFGPWLHAIAVNRCRSHLRDAVRRSAHEQPLALDPTGVRSTVLSSVVRRESTEAVALAIDRLPILLREAFVLRVLESMSYDEAAEVTGASVEALHVRVHRARALLRRQLGSIVDTFWSEGA